VLASPVTMVHREQIVAPAARHRLPAVYPYRYFAANGRLVALSFLTSTGARRRMSIVS
jgi:hypothetical protein